MPVYGDIGTKLSSYPFRALNPYLHSGAQCDELPVRGSCTLAVCCAAQSDILDTGACRVPSRLAGFAANARNYAAELV